MSVLTQKIRKAEYNATLSSCCGVTGEAALTDSAVILLYAGLLGAGDFLTLLSTAVLPLLNGLLIVPMAGIAPYCGSRKLVVYSNVLALNGYLAAVSAPWTGAMAVPFLLGGILLFAVCQTGFVSGWFPMLDTFLMPERRTLFLGRMRFFHQISAVLFLAGVSAVLGKNPQIGLLQAALFAGACVFAGRILFILRIPYFEEPEKEKTALLNGLKISCGNIPLIQFSIYCFVLNLAMFAVIPFMLLFLKNVWQIPDNELVLISAAAVAGMPFGYFSAHWMQKKYGEKGCFVLLHILLLVSLTVLFAVPSGGTVCKIIVAGGLFLIGFCIAAESVAGGAKMMSLARPGNKTVAMAFWGMFYYGGAGIARLAASFLLTSGLFAEQVHIAGTGFSKYHQMLLICIAVALAGTFYLFRMNREYR